MVCSVNNMNSHTKLDFLDSDFKLLIFKLLFIVLIEGLDERA